MGNSAAFAASAWWCLKDTRIREIVVTPTDNGGCAVDYRKPMESIYQEALWRSSFNQDFCREKGAELQTKLVQGAWTCGPEFFVPDTRADRSAQMGSVLEYAVDFRNTVSGQPYLQELVGAGATSLSVALYSGPIVQYDGDDQEADGEGAMTASSLNGTAADGKSVESPQKGIGRRPQVYLFSFEAGCRDSLENVATRCHYFAVVPNFTIGGWAGSLADDESAFRDVLGGAVICPAEDSQTILVEDDIFLYGSKSGLDRQLSQIDDKGLWITEAATQSPVAKVVVHKLDHRYVLRCRAHGGAINQ
ncbi:MAG: hypothetical protein AAF530_22065 [Pseudomonadota bacterium]